MVAISFMLLVLLFDDEECVSGRDADRSLTVCTLDECYSCGSDLSGYSAKSSGECAADDIRTSALDGLTCGTCIRTVDALGSVDIVGLESQSQNLPANLDIGKLELQSIGEVAGGHQMSIPRNRHP